MTNCQTAPKITPVILCGGSGSRLWPVSRETYPKPFVKMENGSTLFDETLKRAIGVCGRQMPVIVCNDSHRFYVLESLAQCESEGRIILEPVGRNTAPAIALAALSLTEDDQDSLMLVMPSDHLIPDTESFRQAVLSAAPLASEGKIAAFGIVPERPECGYGYIKGGKPLAGGCQELQKFIEKPDTGAAQKMLADGCYYWNSGIFLLSASIYLEELARFAPDIFTACKEAWKQRRPDPLFSRPDTALFEACPPNSIDYAVMEHTDKAVVRPLEAAWSDLGSWQSFYEAQGKDEEGNVLIGDVMAVNSQNCYLHAQDRLLATIGIKDIAVVETRDAVLVAPLADSQNVKQIVARLKNEKREEYKFPSLVYRPWGSFEVLSIEDRFQVKRIIVKPGGSLSLQLHHHRAEHWVVVRGTAEVTIGQDTRLLTENQSVYIPVGCKHKLVNPGKISLELIEIQSGSYLGEDDITRFEDIYGRN